MTKTPHRIREAATRLFAERGYEGTSVRAICAEAGANLNAVSYHFGGKQALYSSLLRSWGQDRFRSARRILGTPADTPQALRTQLQLFIEESLDSLLESPELLVILYTEFQQHFRNSGPEVLTDLMEQNLVLIRFLEHSQAAGLIRGDIDVAMVAGTLNERLNNQVMYADHLASMYGASIRDAEYRRHWVDQSVTLLLFGAAAP